MADVVCMFRYRSVHAWKITHHHRHRNLHLPDINNVPWVLIREHFSSYQINYAAISFFLCMMHAVAYTEDVLSPHLFPLITQTSHLVAKWCEMNYAQFACGGKYGNYCELLLRRYQISVIYLRQNDSFIPSGMHASLEKGTPLCTHGESSTPVYKGKKISWY